MSPLARFPPSLPSGLWAGVCGELVGGSVGVDPGPL